VLRERHGEHHVECDTEDEDLITSLDEPSGPTTCLGMCSVHDSSISFLVTTLHWIKVDFSIIHGMAITAGTRSSLIRTLPDMEDDLRMFVALATKIKESAATRAALFVHFFIIRQSASSMFSSPEIVSPYQARHVSMHVCSNS
jgi:hypothetical protein